MACADQKKNAPKLHYFQTKKRRRLKDNLSAMTNVVHQAVNECANFVFLIVSFIPLFGVSFAWRLVVIANNAIFGVWCTFYVPTRMKRCPKMPLSDSGLTATSHQHKLWSSVHNHFFRIIKMCKQCQHRHNGSVPWRKRKFWIWITKCREAASVMRCFPHHFQIYVIWVITPHLGFV